MLFWTVPDRLPIESRECDPAEHSHPANQPPANSALLMTGMYRSKNVEAAARLFRALGDGARLKLAAHLLTGERCVGDLAALEGEALSTISQRLRVLHGEHVVSRRRIGKHVSYALADAHVAELVQNALAHASE